MLNTCKTIRGPEGWNGKWKCQFPFQYDGEIFMECINGKRRNGESFSWCSTKVEGEDRTHVNGHWGICSRDCSCKTVGGSKYWKVEDNCQFPFAYSGKEYHGCIEYALQEKDRSSGHGPKGSWCSTEVHLGRFTSNTLCNKIFSIHTVH